MAGPEALDVLAKAGRGWRLNHAAMLLAEGGVPVFPCVPGGKTPITRHGHLDATTFMEYLIRRNIPQRTAHHLVGQLVRKALDQGCSLAELPLCDYQAAHPDLDNNVYEILGVDKAIDAFVSYGSTASVEVAKQVGHWKTKLKMMD